MKSIKMLFLMAVPLSVYGINISFNELRLKEQATMYGNKTANLQELERVAKSLNEEVGASDFAVPAFMGISDANVKDYLRSVIIPGEESLSVLDFIMRNWQEFKQSQPKDATSLTDGAKKPLERIRTEIQKVFDVDLFKPEGNGKLEQFLKGAQQKGILLMVRSTGREDSKELANAGGNESVSSVKPNIKDISNAMGEVVASYFSEKSLGQRILAYDKQLYAEPFMPVLLQVMIGERPNKKDQMPTSGVIFSREAEGKTPGVVNIQSTLGHNEGLVNGIVAVDTFYVGPSSMIHPLIAVKRERLKPLPHINLCLLKILHIYKKYRH